MNETIETAELRAPRSTQDKIVFRWDQNSSTFDTSHYVPTLTNNRVQHNQIDRFFDSLRQTENYSAAQNTKAIFCIIPVFILGFFGMFGLIMYIASSEKGSIFLILFLFFAFFFSIAGCMFCILASSQKKYLKQIKKREEEFKVKADDFNKREMIPKGWYWRIGTYGAWISLDRNTSVDGSGFTQIQPQFLPPLNPLQNPQMMMLNQQRVTQESPNYNYQGGIGVPPLMPNSGNFDDGVLSRPVPYQPPPVENAKRMDYPESFDINVGGGMNNS